MKCFVKCVYKNEEGANNVINLLSKYDPSVRDRCVYDPQNHKISGLVDFLHSDKDNFMEVNITPDREIDLILDALDNDEIRMIRENSLTGDCLYTSKIYLSSEFDGVSKKYEGHPVIEALDDKKLRIP